jgi:hypothetical protein
LFFVVKIRNKQGLRRDSNCTPYTFQNADKKPASFPRVALSLDDSGAPNPSRRHPLSAPPLATPPSEGATSTQPGWAARMAAAGRFPPDGGGAVELFRRVRRRPPVHEPRDSGGAVGGVPQHPSYFGGWRSPPVERWCLHRRRGQIRGRGGRG